MAAQQFPGWSFVKSGGPKARNPWYAKGPSGGRWFATRADAEAWAAVSTAEAIIAASDAS